MKNSQTSEIIDLLLPETVCNDMTDFPIRVEGATGGLLLRNTPIICGGWNITHNLQCYIIGNNEISIDLIHRYVHITASKWALLLLKSLFQKIDEFFYQNEQKLVRFGPNSGKYHVQFHFGQKSIT